MYPMVKGGVLNCQWDVPLFILNLSHLVEVLFVSFLYSEINFSFIFHNIIFGRKSLYSPHLRSRELSSSSSRVKYIHKLFGFMYINYFSSFIYLFNNLLAWTHRYLFYTLSYNLIVTIVLFIAKCSIFDYEELISLAPMYHWHTFIIVSSFLTHVLRYICNSFCVYISVY